MSNFPVYGSSRTIYVADTGNDDNSGLSPQEAVQTLEKAMAIVPTLNPEITNPVGVEGIAASRFVLSQVMVIPDDTQVFLGDCTVIGDIKAGSRSQCTVGTHLGTYDTNGASRTGFTARACLSLISPNPVISVSGASDENFVTTNQIVLRDDNLTGIDYTATGAASESISAEVIDIGDVNTTPTGCRAVFINEPNQTNVYISNGKVRDNGGAGNTGVWVESGKVVDSNRFINMSAGNTAIWLNSDKADYTIISPEVNGDILTEVGSDFYPNITRYTGTALLLGNVNGIIGGVRYGSYQEANILFQSFFLAGNIRPAEQEAGILSFDATQDTLSVLEYIYLQTTTNSRTVNVSLVDASDHLIIYYQSSNTSTGTPSNAVTIDVNAPVTPLPSGNVHMVVLVNRDGGGGQGGVMDFQLNTERTRL